MEALPNMNIKAKMEQEELKYFTAKVFNDWHNRYESAKRARHAWDMDYLDCEKIRKNEIPLIESRVGLDKATDKFFKDNWLLISNILKVSYMQQADIIAILKSFGVLFDDTQEKEVLQSEVNYTLSEFDIVRKTEPVIADMVWFGYGISYFGWNNRAIDQTWQTGKPEFRRIDPRRWWVDESSHERGWKDRRWSFLLESYDVETAKTLYPEFANKISEDPANTYAGDRSGKLDMFDVITVQYKKLKIFPVVVINYYVDGVQKSEEVLADDVQNFIANFPAGKEIPDNIEIGEQYEKEDYIWFQFQYSLSQKMLLKEPEYIGRKDHYQILWGLDNGDDVYPRSWTHMLKDHLDLKTIALTVAAVQAVQNGIDVPMFEEGAIKNEGKALKELGTLNAKIEISREWRKKNPEIQKPVEMLRRNFNPDVTLILNNLATESIKNSMGATDIMRGVPPYSNMSGVQTSQLQATGMIYTKQDELAYRDYIKEIMEMTLQYVGEYRVYEHWLEDINAKGENVMIMVNEGNISDWSWEKYYCEPIIQNSPEVEKRMDEEKHMKIHALGGMSTLRLLKLMDYNDAARMWQEAMEEKGYMNIIALLQKYPQLEQILPALAQRLDEGMGSEPAQKKIA
jgi:hypothetical protein